MPRINFQAVSAAARGNADAIVRRWLPAGKRSGAEWVAHNPRRNDHRLGSFKVNLRTGRWGDFATGEGGSDLISLAAFLFNLSQADAAMRVADMLGISPYE